MNFQQYSILPLQEVAVRTVSDGYTLYFGWLHPLLRMATPFGRDGYTLYSKRCSLAKEVLYPQKNGLQFFHICLGRYAVAHLFFTL